MNDGQMGRSVTGGRREMPYFIMLMIMFTATGIRKVPLVRDWLQRIDNSGNRRALIWARPLLAVAVCLGLGMSVAVTLVFFSISIAVAIRRNSLFGGYSHSQDTPERRWARRWISLPLLGSVCLALALSSLASGAWLWDTTNMALVSASLFWMMLRPGDWNIPT
jgi:hypothetical protein